MRSPKSVADIGCIFTNGTAYSGNASTTESGLTCQMWSVDTPHNHSYNNVGEHNYCRNPDGDGVWCFTTDPGKLWEYCDIPLCVIETQSAEEIGCKPTDGTAYTGHANITVSGRICQMWSVNKIPHDSEYPDVGEHNYCRSPDGDDVWCFTTDPGKLWEYCDVPLCVIETQYAEEIACKPTNGTAYNGYANITVSGLTCQMWSVDTPHNHSYNNVGEHNYCRNPDGDGVWCFTTDPGKLWEYCDIPLCVIETQSAEEIGCKPTDGTAYTGHANITVSGRICQMWSVNKIPHDSEYPDVGEHNYCRSPDGDDVWCFTTDPGKLWEYCDVPLCVIDTQSAEEIGCKPTDGTAYTGHANTTVSGLICQMWSVDTPHESYHPEVGEHNYCRSPDGDHLWCYTTDPLTGWEYCEVPDCVAEQNSVEDVDCVPTDGTAYTGKTNTTESGRTCQMWSDLGYHHIGEHNYCRDLGNGLLCFISDVKKQSEGMGWEYCDVPVCVTLTKGN